MSVETFRIRNHWDQEIAESVLVHDEYRLRDLHAAGEPVRWVLDVGAHVGAFTRLVKQLWPQASVIAVEPDPTAAPYWHFNTFGSDGLYWHPQAIVPAGGPNRVRLMHSADQNAAANFTAEIVAEFTPLPADRSFDDVPAIDIIRLLAEHGSPALDVVKLDCEGAEALILEDLQKAGYLNRIARICGEWHYHESIPRIEAALRETHRLQLFSHEYPWGPFCAERHSDISQLHTRQKMDANSLAIPNSIQEMYPRVPVEILVSDEMQRRFTSYFLDSAELSNDPFEFANHTDRCHKKCIAVSLFKRNANNRTQDEFPVDEEYWHAKYWNGWLGIVNELAHFPDWKLRIYVEKDLWDDVFSEFSTHPQIELYRMNVNSVGASPGTLWRFLALSDKSLDVVLVTDIDEPLIYKNDYISSFEMDTWSSIGRLGGFKSDRRYLVAPNESSAKNYASILASRVMSRPKRFDFDIAAAMRGFMAYRRLCSESDRPWAYDETEFLSDYNRPIGAFVHGFGSHWYMYGFDERFLKHVLYYHFSEKGEIHTWAESMAPSVMDPEGVCDATYVRSKGNTTVFPYNAVKLGRLNLSSEALRIAFLLDEYRWIFDCLMQMMREHAESGTCGNLFFHDIDKPYFVDLVPKQLNLFKAARHATKVMEIGFNAGHSAALMLLANPQLTIRAFDVCWLAYTRPCAEFLKSIFEGRLTLIAGSSQSTVKADVESGYDLVHIDADHTFDAVAMDLANSLSKCAHRAVVVMDDYEEFNEVARATLLRTDLVQTDAFTVSEVLPGSSHAIFEYRQPPVPRKMDT